ncbi:Protein SMAX1-LIKE 8 [Camellia lanceoleosa]|uniref:Protein SMAX1-LIKE 8 n=1 Tax=Camellia lanceoleosa TaxID=1840588 RepID=A0ACC0H8L5_9ERIC|nr:Protein SMAX1-LIKE 8 [Camellia lanceoleosa]
MEFEIINENDDKETEQDKRRHLKGKKNWRGFGLRLVCVEKEISEFVEKGGSKEMIDLKLKEVSDLMEHCYCSGTGIVVNFGDLKVLIGDRDGVSIDAVNYVVSQLSNLVEVHGEKLWLIGAAGSYETYLKILA